MHMRQRKMLPLPWEEWPALNYAGTDTLTLEQELLQKTVRLVYLAQALVFQEEKKAQKGICI